MVSVAILIVECYNRPAGIRRRTADQMVEEGVVKLSRIDSTDQVADLLTKPLPRPLFQKHYEQLRMKATESIE